MSEQDDPLATTLARVRSHIAAQSELIDDFVAWGEWANAEIKRLRAERQKWLALERAVRNMKVYPGLAVDLAMQELPE